MAVLSWLIALDKVLIKKLEPGALDYIVGSPGAPLTLARSLRGHLTPFGTLARSTARGWINGNFRQQIKGKGLEYRQGIKWVVIARGLL